MDYLDVSFDPLFAARPQVKWWPWVGAQYSRSSVKTIILGESVYRWTERDAFEKRYARTSGLRETHANHALKFQRPSRYVRNIERAIYQRRNPSDAQKQMLWSSVCYHNLVLDVMDSAKHRPEPHHFEKGWAAALDLFDLLSVEQCLVFGVESLGALQLTAGQSRLNCNVTRHPTEVGRFCARSGSVDTATGRRVKLLFVRHPSAFFSWRKWSPVVQEGLQWDFADDAPVRRD